MEASHGGEQALAHSRHINLIVNKAFTAALRACLNAQLFNATQGNRCFGFAEHRVDVTPCCRIHGREIRFVGCEALWWHHWSLVDTCGYGSLNKDILVNLRHRVASQHTTKQTSCTMEASHGGEQALAHSRHINLIVNKAFTAALRACPGAQLFDATQGNRCFGFAEHRVDVAPCCRIHGREIISVGREALWWLHWSLVDTWSYHEQEGSSGSTEAQASQRRALEIRGDSWHHFCKRKDTSDHPGHVLLLVQIRRREQCTFGESKVASSNLKELPDVILLVVWAEHLAHLDETWLDLVHESAQDLSTLQPLGNAEHAFALPGDLLHPLDHQLLALTILRGSHDGSKLQRGGPVRISCGPTQMARAKIVLSQK